uniref:Uncharacterized protein n=1 Tax=Junco hyemalis TaxID=40217 RepID=A0A8C5IX01_JUNHY
AMDAPIPQEIQRLLEEAEGYLCQALREEPLSARARDQGAAILRSLQRLRARWVPMDFPEFRNIPGTPPAAGIPPRFGIVWVFQAWDNGRILGCCRCFGWILSGLGWGFSPLFIRKEFWDISDLFSIFRVGISPSFYKEGVLEYS